MTRVRRVAEVAVGVLSALVVFLGVPAALAGLLGMPVPRVDGHLALWSRHGVFDAVDVAAWALWVCLCAQVVHAVVAEVRGGRWRRRWGDRMVEVMAAPIAAAVLTVVPWAPGAAGASGVTGAEPPVRVTRTAPVAALAAPAVPAAPAAPATATATATARRPPPHGHCVVAPGESLWLVAQRVLGDGSDWPLLAHHNVGRVMADGGRLVDANLVRAGWTMAVAAPGRTGAADRVRPRPGRPDPVPLPELVALGLGTVVAAAAARQVRRRQLLDRFERPARSVPAAGSPAAEEVAGLLPRFAGSPALDLLATANHELGHLLDQVGAPGAEVPARLVRVGPDGVDLWLARPASTGPPAGWSDGGTLRWHRPHELGGVPRPPVTGHHAGFPALLPVGEDDRGTWLLCLHPGACLPVLGAGAADLVSALRLALATWPWAAQLTVTHDTAVAGAAVRAGAGTPSSSEHRCVVFVGRPEDLDERTRAGCALLTTEPVPATDVTVVADLQGATVHPLGLSLRSRLLPPARAATFEELLTGGHATASAADQPGATASAADQPGVTAQPQSQSQSQPQPQPQPQARRQPQPQPQQGTPPARHAERPAGRAPATRPAPVPVPETGFGSGHDTGPGSGPGLGPPAIDQLAPGLREVRLLVAVPRLEGLVVPLDPKRARRAVELTAYLALHHPDPVTNDRLRTRVLGSADVDAAAKTVFNTVTVARQSLGNGPDGSPLLPPATRGHHYGVSPLVTCDAVRAAGLVRAARGADDPQVALACYRAALQLVEAEPFSGVVSGYDWWTAEGHAGRVGALLADAAAELAAQASDAGLHELARWGLERARLVEPFSEVLAEAAMRAAAAAGDGDQLRREWGELQRQAEELDPGAGPSPGAERLYAELRRRVAS